MSSTFYPKSEAFTEFQTKLPTDNLQPRLTSCTVTKNNEIIVVDLNNKVVKIFEFFGDVIRTIGKDGAVKLKCPWDVTLTPTGDICITEVANACIRVYSSVGKYLYSIGCCGEVNKHAERTLQTPPKTFNATPNSKATNRQASLDVIQEESLDTEESPVGYDHLPFFPRGIDYHVTGNFVISNSPPIHSALCHSIYVIKPADGSTVSKLIGAFSRPLYLACHPLNNSLLVSDTYRSMVASYDPIGRCQYQYGNYGTGPQQLAAPHGICVDREGMVYIADHGNHRIVILRDGKLSRFIYGGIKYPTSVAYSTTGHLIVTEQHGTVRLFNLPRKIK
ncbi:uncharacterized protein LOC106180436 [Lingula anatina]|uniref:Uncharacterized protein LOC106180436 n=1 Tax=Lingula anatina TaxID=7574 RepID=A0A1S3KBK3_LINAN|nr:uncharacterized protein LOC106180436 [Lingula anatina]|eukprot:XP_013419872.1 uncharacterized protein LOC106180436 [Lingula anatina]